MELVKSCIIIAFPVFLLFLEVSEGGSSPPPMATIDYMVRKNLLLHAKAAQDAGKCDSLITQKESNEIVAHKPTAKKIIDFIVNGTFKGESYKELKKFVEKFPLRPSGHEYLEKAIDYLMEIMKSHGLDNVRSESVKIPMWNASKSQADMVRPFEREFKLLVIQNSTTPTNSGITAHVIVVKSFEDLERRKEEIRGKIVVFNHGFLGYGKINSYKANGALEAAKYGAVAALISSTAYPSFDSSFATQVNYWPNVTHIPAAIISMDDANKLQDLQDHHKEIVFHLHIKPFNDATNPSKNAMGDIAGHVKKEVVVLVAHTDCENEVGGTSDASGIFLSIMTLAALKNLKLTPHRTMIAALLTGNEEGLWGAEAYVQKHKAAFGSYSAVMQSDGGAFKPLGIDFAGSEKAGCIIREILRMCEPLMATAFARLPAVSTDIMRFTAEGVPGLSLMTEDKVRLLKRHKQDGDTIDAIESEELDAGVALWSVVSYVLADIPFKLPR